MSAKEFAARIYTHKLECRSAAIEYTWSVVCHYGLHTQVNGAWVRDTAAELFRLGMSR